MGIDSALSCVQWWGKVKKFKENDDDDDYMFLNIATYALNVLCLPVSNSYVERVFSLVSFIKDKYANPMGTPMLNAILLLKTHLQVRTLGIFSHFT